MQPRSASAAQSLYYDTVWVGLQVQDRGVKHQSFSFHNSDIRFNDRRSTHT